MKVVFDIDGTIADNSARYEHIKSEIKNWDAYYAATETDKPIWPVIEMLKAMHKSSYEIVFLTGRPEKTRQVTVQWIENFVGLTPKQYQMFMRDDDDRRPNEEMKLSRLAHIDPTLGREIEFIVEDLPRTVDMWRENGIPVLQVVGNWE
jgi:phosphoglycolate phosphatase-like HAD superfamily hydrolase